MKVKTLMGEKSVNVKPGSQDGEKIRLQGLVSMKAKPLGDK